MSNTQQPSQSGDKLPVNKRSYVAQDQIWKDYVGKVNYYAKKWPENWGFLNGKLEDVKFKFK